MIPTDPTTPVVLWIDTEGTDSEYIPLLCAPLGEAVKLGATLDQRGITVRSSIGLCCRDQNADVACIRDQYDDDTRTQRITITDAATRIAATVPTDLAESDR